MVNSYLAPLSYGEASLPLGYDNIENSQRKYSNLPLVAGTAIVGASAGGFIGSRINPKIKKNGMVSDTFAKAAYERYVKKVPEAGKDSYNQSLEILKKIDKIKTPEDLKALFTANPDAAKMVCVELEGGVDNFLDGVTKENLNANKKLLKDQLKSGNTARYQNMKNWIQSCWDKKKKKFVRPDDMSKELFNAIKHASYGGKTKLIAMGAAIGGVVAGSVAYIGSKIMSARAGAIAQQMPETYPQAGMQNTIPQQQNFVV